MIDTIALKFGPVPGGPPLQFCPGTVTVVVGPNNSGKSLLIRELDSLQQGQIPRLIVQDVTLRSIGPAAAKRIEQQVGLVSGQLQLRNCFTNGGMGFNNIEELRRILIDPAQASQLKTLVSFLKLRLDGVTRLNLCNDQGVGDLSAPPSGALAALYRDDAVRGRLRALVLESFGLHLVFDPTSVGQIRLKLSKVPLPHPELERHLTQAAIEFFAGATQVSAMSDGVRAYIGILTAALSVPSLMLLIDEPEAFLHPPLVRSLGKTLATLASERDGIIVAATHSPDFVMGCIQSGKSVNILRLTWEDAVPKARLLASEEVAPLMKDPRLRSAGPISALFYRSAVICESDADRVFYQEVNDRLLTKGHIGIKDCLFTNVQNLQTIRLLMEPLRKMGIPAAAVVDLDLITDSEQRHLYRAAGIPDGMVKTLGQWTGEVREAFERLNLKPKRAGIEALNAADRDVAATLLCTLRQYGIFVVPVGELERWLACFSISGPKSEWLGRMLERLGTDPEDSAYVQAGESDVWGFLTGIAQWVNDSHRKGLC
jgi:ABC-type polar amino acid transport system ATPase subunit